MSTVRNKDGIEFDIDAIATDVNGKLDKDLTNIDSISAYFISLLTSNKSFINTIIDNLTPDYTKLQTISNPFTAPKSGVMAWNNQGTTNATVNDIPVYIGGNDASNEGPAILIVQKDDVVSFSNDSGTPWFAPFKGAI